MNKRWWMALGYVAFIYATLGVIGLPMRILRSWGMLRVSILFFYLLCFSVLLKWFIYRGARQWWRYAVLVGVFALVSYIAPNLSRPEEEIHFFEYGLVGVLFARALEGTRPWNGILFLIALGLASAVGWMDEFLQGFIPGRHYELHDVGMNAVAAFLGLSIFAVFPRKDRSSTAP